MNYTKEEKEIILEELLQHREEIFEHLDSIAHLVECLGHGIDMDRMEAYWLPSIKGSLGDEMYPHSIMISMEDTIQDLQDGLKEEEEVLSDSDPQEDDAEFEEHEEQVFRDAKLEEVK